ncbi:hypothetical protein NQ318_009848 [Aromia moschata]|uniref:Uncharacterized protein n=1 Tax=Aromia moschata TaxID=1265417 RepID=A0AAV8XA33_9CUCU|nr:hypothetical protein NQ318_009848 [Aromia moschata]
MDMYHIDEKVQITVMQEQLNKCTLKYIPKDADRGFERLYRFTHDFVKLKVLCLVTLAVAELQHEILNLMVKYSELLNRIPEQVSEELLTS